MKIKSSFLLGAAFGLFVAFILLIGILLWNFTISRSLFPLVPVVTGLSNPPQPTIDDLSRRVDKLENDQASTLRDIAWKMDQKLIVITGITLVIAAITGFLGIKTYADLDKVIQNKTNSALEKALYQLDPTNLPIWLCKYRMGQTIQTDSDKKLVGTILSRLKLTGLDNIRYIDYPDKKIRRGVTILLITNDDEEQVLVEFLNRSVAKPGQSDSTEKFLHANKAALILYTGFEKKIKPSTFDIYENMVTANMPATVANMVLVVGRGLKNSSN